MLYRYKYQSHFQITKKPSKTQIKQSYIKKESDDECDLISDIENGIFSSKPTIHNSNFNNSSDIVVSAGHDLYEPINFTTGGITGSIDNSFGIEANNGTKNNGNALDINLDDENENPDFNSLFQSAPRSHVFNSDPYKSYAEIKQTIKENNYFARIKNTDNNGKGMNTNVQNNNKCQTFVNKCNGLTPTELDGKLNLRDVSKCSNYCYANEYYEMAMVTPSLQTISANTKDDYFNIHRKINAAESKYNSDNQFSRNTSFDSTFSSNELNNYKSLSLSHGESPCSINSEVVESLYDLPSVNFFKPNSEPMPCLSTQKPQTSLIPYNLNEINSDNLCQLVDSNQIGKTTRPVSSSSTCSDENLINLKFEIPSFLSFSNSNQIQSYVCTLENSDCNDENYTYNTTEKTSSELDVEFEKKIEPKLEKSSEKVIDKQECFIKEEHDCGDHERINQNEKTANTIVNPDFGGTKKNVKKKSIPKRGRPKKRVCKNKVRNTHKIVKVQTKSISTKKSQKSVIKCPPNDNNNEYLPYVCKHCHKGFERKSNHDSHIRLHLTVKPHICSFCSKGFVRRSDLLRHERSLHLKTTFRCFGKSGRKKWGCGHLYSRKDGLRKHWKSIQGQNCLRQFLALNKLECKYDQDRDLEKIIEMMTNLF